MKRFKQIDALCGCRHDIVDHYPEGCIRCRDLYVSMWEHLFSREN